MILKISVRFTLKELTCELPSSLYIISGSEEGLFFEMKKKNERKRKHRLLEFSHKQEEKCPFNNLTRNKTSR